MKNETTGTAAATTELSATLELTGRYGIETTAKVVAPAYKRVNTEITVADVAGHIRCSIANLTGHVGVRDEGERFEQLAHRAMAELLPELDSEEIEYEHEAGSGN